MHNKLPDWLEAILPELKPPHVLSTIEIDGQRILRVTSPDGETVDFDNIKDVAESKRMNNQDLVIEDDVYDHFDGRSRMLTYKVDRPIGGVGMLLAYSDKDRRSTLESAYESFIKAKKLYEEEPNNFVKAWNFIDTHPAFWTAKDIENHPWYWMTEGYCSKLRQYVYAETDGSPVVQVEAGGHVEHASLGLPAYSEHYGDWRLEVQGSTFEEAILELAFRTSLAFDAHGNSVKESDFPFDEPEWIKTIRDRISESD